LAVVWRGHAGDMRDRPGTALQAGWLEAATMKAAILGIDTAAGAYLARLLGARGYELRGTGALSLLAELGDTSQIILTSPDAAVTGVDEIYDLRDDVEATAALLALGGDARVVASVATPAAAAAIAGDARRAGRFVATAQLGAHESRLGPGTSPLARIVAAIAAGEAPARADLVATDDYGWTAEYVDAMTRLLTLPAGIDDVVATGCLLSGDDAARIAAACFRGERQRFGRATGAPTRSGWRATTLGPELVAILCEGRAARR